MAGSKSKKGIQALAKLGTAKVAGITCNKKSPMTIRIDVEIPHERIGTALKALGLEGTDELVTALEATLAAVKKGEP